MMKRSIDSLSLEMLENGLLNRLLYWECASFHQGVVSASDLVIHRLISQLVALDRLCVFSIQLNNRRQLPSFESCRELAVLEAYGLR